MQHQSDPQLNIDEVATSNVDREICEHQQTEGCSDTAGFEESYIQSLPNDDMGEVFCDGDFALDTENPIRDGSNAEIGSVDEVEVVTEQSSDKTAILQDVAVNQPVGDSQPQQAVKRRTKWGVAFDAILWILIAVLAVAVLVRLFIVTNITVSGDSMLTTYQSGDVVRVCKVVKPNRGDVAVFYKHDVDNKFIAMFSRDSGSGGKYEKLIKRVVAIEDDKIWLEELPSGGYRLVILTSESETLYEDYYTIEGQTLDAESFVIYDGQGSGLGNLAGYTADNPLIISKGHFFALGDNRRNSADSRGELGQVPYERLYGVVV